jgi:serine/threonine protein kinase
MVGTPHYMAPEQITAKKDVGPTIDIYAMGILLYEALAGDPPFVADHQMDLFRMHLKEKPKLLAKKFPGEFLEVFDEVIQKAMAKKPEERYQSADEMRLAMEKALVASVAKEQELLETTQSRKRLTPSEWMEEKTNVRGVVPPMTEESTGRFSVHDAKTILFKAPVAETVKIQRLFSPEKEWLMSPTEPTMMPIVRQPLARVRREVGFWSRVSKLWRFFKR